MLGVRVVFRNRVVLEYIKYLEIEKFWYIE